MKPKLQRFTEFANQLLPHELYYLQAVAQFADADNGRILARIARNVEPEAQPLPYDEAIDKRKYSKLIRWIEGKLAAIDVDQEYEWMQQLGRRIMTDSVRPEDEQQLLRSLRRPPQARYYFTQFYELLRDYRQFLCIRMRHQDHRLVHAYLEAQAPAYERARATYDQLHRATVDIIKQYARNNTETRQWEAWLREVFFDEAMDGLNRYFAAVRLTFIYLNYRAYDELLEIYDALDAAFRRGLFYSRRILLNYYANRVLLHGRTGELERAISYGYLSIRQKNADYLHYVNNLSALLLRQGDKEKALELMRVALPEVRQTKSFHNRVGFVAFYIRCLNENQQARQAEQYAEGFLRGYKEQVFEQRWHLLFSAYLQSLMEQEKYEKLLRVVSKYRLMEKEEAYESRAGYLPTLRWYQAVARYKEGRLNAAQLRQLLALPPAREDETGTRHRLLRELQKELKRHVPEVVVSE